MSIFLGDIPLGGSGGNRVAVITTSGTWTHPDGATPSEPKPVTLLAIGGGGGGGAGGHAYQNNHLGGGGGSGALVELAVFTLEGDLTVTVGAGGAGGEIGQSGTAGGTTTAVAANNGTLKAAGGQEGKLGVAAQATPNNTEGLDGGISTTNGLPNPGQSTSSLDRSWGIYRMMPGGGGAGGMCYNSDASGPGGEGILGNGGAGGRGGKSNSSGDSFPGLPGTGFGGGGGGGGARNTFYGGVNGGVGGDGADGAVIIYY